jgi:hypothetical protein
VTYLQRSKGRFGHCSLAQRPPGGQPEAAQSFPLETGRFFPLCCLLKSKTFRIFSFVSPDLSHFDTVRLVGPLFSGLDFLYR